MKKLITLASAALVAISAVAVPQAHNLKNLRHELKPEAKLMLKKNLENFSNRVEPTEEEAKTIMKAWTDPNTQSPWTLQVRNLGWVGDLMTFTNNKGEVVEVTKEQLPYYFVTTLFEKYPTIGVAEDDLTDAQKRTILTQWNLWWPSYSEWQLPDYPLTNERPEDLSAVTFDDFCNLHVSQIDFETPYCSIFKENDDPDYLPTGDFDLYQNPEDGLWYYNDYTALNWGMEFAGCLINGQYFEKSGFDGGNLSTIDFKSFDPRSEWTELAARLFLNGNNRFDVNFSSDIRLEGWETKFLAYPKVRELHIFNRGVKSHALAGDTDIYYSDWGPLQIYQVWGLGQWIEMEIDEAEAKAGYNERAIMLGLIPEYITAGVPFVDTQNYFRGALFCEVGADIEKGGRWKMLEPYNIPGSKVWTVDPVANSMVPAAIFDSANSDYLLITNDSFQDRPVYMNTWVNLKTTQGFILNYNNGSNEYTAYFDGDIIYHYDDKDMTLTRTFSAVGDLEPDEVSVDEIESNNEVAPVYYNLQGVRVNNPEKGLFIKVQGKKVTKVAF